MSLGLQTPVVLAIMSVFKSLNHLHRLGLDGLLSSDDVVLPVPVIDKRDSRYARCSLPVKFLRSLLQFSKFLVQLFNLNKEEIDEMRLHKAVLPTCS